MSERNLPNPEKIRSREVKPPTKPDPKVIQKVAPKLGKTAVKKPGK